MLKIQTHRDWVASLQTGSTLAFQKLFDLHGKRLYTLARSFKLDHDQAEEIVQETFVILWEKRFQLEPALNLDAYIKKIARNQILKSMQKAAFVAASLYIKDKNQSIAPPEIESKLNSIAIEQVVQQVLGRLSPQTKNIYILSRNYGFSHAEIANQLKISQRTVENQIYRTLQKLKVALNQQDLLILFMASCYCLI